MFEKPILFRQNKIVANYVCPLPFFFQKQQQRDSACNRVAVAVLAEGDKNVFLIIQKFGDLLGLIQSHNYVRNAKYTKIRNLKIPFRNFVYFVFRTFPITSFYRVKRSDGPSFFLLFGPVYSQFPPPVPRKRNASGAGESRNSDVPEPEHVAAYEHEQDESDDGQTADPKAGGVKHCSRSEERRVGKECGDRWAPD